MTRYKVTLEEILNPLCHEADCEVVFQYFSLCKESNSV